MSSTNANSSQLLPVHPTDIHDLICIGFGPASLAIAIALQDTLAKSTHHHSSHGIHPKVTFLERQDQFFWHAGMLLPGAKMQISFIKDLATLRDPKSEFTFLNYLHQHDRLVPFCNLGTFLPLREEYQDYMKWCAGHFEDVVSYNQEVLEIIPNRIDLASRKIDSFVVQSKNRSTGELQSRVARHVVIAVGGKPRIPRQLPQNCPRVVHSSQYAKAVPKLLDNKTQNYNIIVIGAGQSAAEIFNDLQGRYPNAKTTLVVKGTALRPSDDSPFVNEIFDPERVDSIYNQSPEHREAAIQQDRGTNYGVVRLELLEHIYSKLYTQRLRMSNEAEWPHRILTETLVSSIEDSPCGNTVRVHLASVPKSQGAAETMEYHIDAHAVFVATGYDRNAHEDMLRPVEYLRHESSEEVHEWQISRNYQIQLDPSRVEQNAGIWLQGCNEKTHGLSDTLLSILATRGGEMVDSIFGPSLKDKARFTNGFATPPSERM